MDFSGEPLYLPKLSAGRLEVMGVNEVDEGTCAESKVFLSSFLSGTLVCFSVVCAKTVLTLEAGRQSGIL